MFAPDDCPRPKPGLLVAWCKRDYCGGAWLVVDHNRRIKTQFSEPWSAARFVNWHNAAMQRSQ